MSTNVEKAAAAAGSVAPGGAGASKYAGMMPKGVDSVGVMSSEKCVESWGKIYKAAGVASAGESTKVSVRCAFYAYCLLNGTSPKGEYSGRLVSSAGTVVDAVVLPTAVGTMDVRRFMRGNAQESVDFFRANAPGELDPVRAKCETLGIRVSDALALADWLDATTGLTPSEREAQQQIKNFSLQRATRSRGGTVEDMRRENMQDAVAAQGPALSVQAPDPRGW